MNIQEYEKVKDMDYLEYCDYLQRKYGISQTSYFTKNWSKCSKVTRTAEGLIVHHKFEDHAIKLGDVKYARNNPYEWQQPENLVYCDYLEHLLLHIMICENPAADKNKNEFVGIGGVINHLVPELNDLFSGWEPSQPWRKNCKDRIINNKDVYLVLLNRFRMNYDGVERNGKSLCKFPSILLSSATSTSGTWSIKNNIPLFNEIRNYLESQKVNDPPSLAEDNNNRFWSQYDIIII